MHRPAIASSTSQPPLPKVLVLTGPTSVGKSAAAVTLCRKLRGEIVSADSVQLYRHLDIASNKPSLADRVQTPHHVVDIADPRDDFSAGDFFLLAREALRHILSRDRLPVVVGGTMMYVRWLIHGRPATPRASTEARERAERMVADANGDWDVALAMLAAKDRKRAEGLSRNDWYRLRRALEVVDTAGMPMTQIPLVGAAPKATPEQQQRLDFDFRCFFLVGERERMYRRIDKRCEQMIVPDNSDDGTSILEEVCQLLLSSMLRVGPGSPCLAIGYRQTIAYLATRALEVGEEDGIERSMERFREFVDKFQQATRRYAKQQIAWFRKEEGFHWVFADDAATERIEELMGLDRQEFVQECERLGQEQEDMKTDMVGQGRRMKGYISERVTLIKGSAAEEEGRRLAEDCARRMRTGIEREELERIVDVVRMEG